MFKFLIKFKNFKRSSSLLENNSENEKFDHEKLILDGKKQNEMIGLRKKISIRELIVKETLNLKRLPEILKNFEKIQIFKIKGHRVGMINIIFWI